MELKTVHMIFEGGGVYVPQIFERCVLWRKDKTGNPFVGVHVPSAERASKFAQVFVIRGSQVQRVIDQKEQGE